MLRILALAALMNIDLTLKTSWVFIGFEGIMKISTDLLSNNKNFRKQMVETVRMFCLPSQNVSIYVSMYVSTQATMFVKIFPHSMSLKAFFIDIAFSASEE